MAEPKQHVYDFWNSKTKTRKHWEIMRDEAQAEIDNPNAANRSADGYYQLKDMVKLACARLAGFDSIARADPMYFWLGRQSN